MKHIFLDTKRRKLPIPRLVNPENDVKPPKKLTPRGGARTRAMTVHESVVNDAQLKIVKTEDLDEGEITQIESHTCDQCGIILYSSIELLEHQRGFHKETIVSFCLFSLNLYISRKSMESQVEHFCALFLSALHRSLMCLILFRI